MQQTRENNKHDLKDTWYGKFLSKENETTFTLTLNTDGIQKHKMRSDSGLWPFIFMINELPFPQRRYVENILLAGIIRAKTSPSNKMVQICLRLIIDHLFLLEDGQPFYVIDLDEQGGIE
ncbi:unnamed protein product [Didymodactylos carnosus]|uniref:Uncharacterized protein n=1 Tax=Didymodactylos carnosus TaxID=1234261 RepID=A0A815F5F6_9BILA|nr:unnamed protein product [Didymodactylos carnosus]CAF1320940.1 unnamed protein product [Didymodactylos carnosus]CAF4007501.1 unnamed protein product [Didymodactylos carnosus]CAF4166683.1 unnamed protein product [Didymodactylos carnosus]